ncbi:MAG: hypothetical protein OHK0029_15830 [Armatimonadaceae bacterium]
MPTIRQARVGEMIKRELSEIIQREMRDPRLGLVSINDVEVARDFSVAKVFISVIGSPKEKADALKALQGAAGFLRGQLGKAIDLKTIPSLAFRYDAAIERGIRITELLQSESEAIAENAERAAVSGDEDSEAETGERDTDDSEALMDADGDFDEEDEDWDEDEDDWDEDDEDGENLAEANEEESPQKVNSDTQEQA